MPIKIRPKGHMTAEQWQPGMNIDGVHETIDHNNKPISYLIGFGKDEILQPGDWVVKDYNSGLFVVKDERFWDLYETVDE